jgi:hypothetical protein
MRNGYGAHRNARVAALALLAMVAIGALVGLGPFPALIDPPSIAPSDLPEWAHTPLRVKNWILGLVVVVGVALDLLHQRRGNDDSGTHDETRR